MGNEGPQPIPLNGSPAPELVLPLGPTEDGANWFLGMCADGNLVTPYIHAFDVYPEIGRIMNLANGDKDFIYICAWDLGLTTDMGGGVFLREVLRRASDDRGVEIRALLYQNQQPFLTGVSPAPPPQNGPAVAFINSLSRGGAIHDGRYLIAGSHHQKSVVVKHGEVLTGFCGGMDMHPARNWWHDVHLKIEGPAAHDLHETFEERWRDHPATAFPNVVLARQFLVPPPPRPSGTGPHQVKVVRTYGNGSAHAGLGFPITLPPLQPPLPMPGGPGVPIPVPPPQIVFPRSTYSFAPTGLREIYNQITHAIRNTRRFIYLEDQYLVEESPMAAGTEIHLQLADKLQEPDFKKLVILIARTESVNQELFQGWLRRRFFINALTSTAPNKVIVCQYAIPPGTRVDTNVPIYVHSKTWIFDDKLALVSSANCNRRGYTHDSEVGAAFFDTIPDGNRLGLPHKLRIDLWMRHLNPQRTPALTERDLLDPIAASSYWTTPPPTALIEPYDVNGDTRAPPQAANPSPDHQLPVDPWIRQHFPILTQASEWNLVIDPDGS